MGPSRSSGIWNRPFGDVSSSWDCPSSARCCRNVLQVPPCGFRTPETTSSLAEAVLKMARGNQRDLAREKAAKKNVGKAKAAKDQESNKGMTLEQRKQRDADNMRAKQQKKAE